MADFSFATTLRAESRLHVGRGELARLGARLAEVMPPARHVAIVTDRNVAPFWLERVTAILLESGYQCTPILVPAGEESKSLRILGNLWDRLLASGVDRAGVVVALGGGVVGDLAGFAAATLLRGTTLVQVATSLLAQVDAAIGGKNGIDRPLGKNLVGTFHQPRLVVIDPDLLATLPERELRSGLGEVIKYGFLRDPKILEGLRRAGDLEGLKAKPELIDDLVLRCVKIKVEIVARDERESGERALLNFGHTIGHALEGADGHASLLHGEAVAIGMVAAAFLAVDLGAAAPTLPAEITELLERFGLPVTTTLKPERLLPFLGRDKKRKSGKARWVLVEAAGRACLVEDPPAASVERALKAVHREAEGDAASSTG
jgi:3-dehydroquinate synthase